MELDNNAHSVFLLYYHLILVIKYRRNVITDPVSDRAKEMQDFLNSRGERAARAIPQIW